MISVVNGYFCETPCDVAKAKRGVDPHLSMDPVTGERKQDGIATDRAAVVFDGALSKALGANSAKPADALQATEPANFWTQKPTVDLLV